MKQLLARLPKKYHDRVENFYSEDGLCDGCKYMLLFKEPYRWDGEFDCLPVFSITEAIKFIKQAELSK